MIVAVASFGVHGTGDARGRVQVVVVAEDEPELGGGPASDASSSGSMYTARAPELLDDVLHLVGTDPEVDRYQRAAVAGNAEERPQQAGTVVADGHDSATLSPGSMPRDKK